MLIGGGGLLLGKILPAGFLGFFSGQKSAYRTGIAKRDSENFRIADNKKELVIYGKNNEEILIIDKQK